jgi:hypothetical protein
VKHWQAMSRLISRSTEAVAGRRSLLHYASTALIAVALLAPSSPAASPQNVASRPPDAYRWARDMNWKLPLFFTLRGQVKLIVVGDSRGDNGADTRGFYSDGVENKQYPIAFNFAVGATGLDVEEVVLKEYASHAPKLEWVVFQISPRIFNEYYQDTGIEELLASKGYQYDIAHRDQVWANLPPDIFRPQDIEPTGPWLGGEDISNARRLQSRLLAEGRANTPGPVRRIWQALPEDGRRKIEEIGQGKLVTGGFSLTETLNTVIGRRDLYDPQDFAGIALTPELKELLGRPAGQLSERDVRRMNRLLLQAAFPQELVPTRRDDCRAWGWHPDLNFSVAGDNPLGDKRETLVAAAERGRYEFAADRWDRFEKLVEYFGKRNVKVLGYTSPLPGLLAETASADKDGTPHATYWALMARLNDLSRKYPNFFFCDMHRGGRHDYPDEEYSTWDHLNAPGSRRLTPRLEALRQAVDAQPKWDVKPPAVAGVTAVGSPDLVSVTFTEPVGKADAETTANYAIDGGAAVKAAQLAADGMTVSLRTSPLTEKVDYSLTARNIRDRADNQMTGAPVHFTFVKSLEAKGVTPGTYVWTKLTEGAPAYVDQATAFTAFPAPYSGLTALRTAEADKGATGDAVISFEVNYPVRVFVVHDEAILKKPLWMESLNYTWDFLEMGKDKFRVAWKDFPAGKVVLGGNAGATGHMYVVLIKPMGTVNPVPASVARGEFVLRKTGSGL